MGNLCVTTESDKASEGIQINIAAPSGLAQIKSNDPDPVEKYSHITLTITGYDKIPDDNKFTMSDEFVTAIGNSKVLALFNSKGGFPFRLADYKGKDNKYEFINQNGIVYYGQIKTTFEGQKIKQGQGYLKEIDDHHTGKAFYAGYFDNDAFEGPGMLIANDRDCYRGIWHNNAMNGFGYFSNSQGLEYEGEWSNMIQEGQGIEKWNYNTTSYVYKGAFRNGKKCGKGLLKNLTADTVYEGDFFDNMAHGKGVYTWPDGKRYEGDLRNDSLHGKGVFDWKDGRRYVGGYVNDKKEGWGEFVWPDGRRYVGNWKDGKQHGTGTFFNEGKEIKGEWEAGKKLKAADK